MTETQGGRAEELAALSLQLLGRGDYRAARDVLTALCGSLPESSSIRSALSQSLGTLTFHLAGGSSPPSQLIDRLASLARQIAFPVRTQPLKPRQSSSANTAKKLGPLGALLALLAKFKTVGLILLTKGKFLLFGLTHIKALISILLFLGVYWALYGWWFALGFVASIFVHEMGHYVTVRRMGFAASAPIFIPGFGAFVRWRGATADPGILARISLAGPLWGMFAAVASYMVYTGTGQGVWLAVAHVGAWINLFNLIPIFIFDGGTAFAALGRQERIAVVIVSLALFFFLGEFVFLFIALGAGYRIFRKDFPAQSYQLMGYYYIGLLVALGMFDWWMMTTASSVFSTFPHGRSLGGGIGW
ncbi:MAG: site-2 protease family protein [Bryobacteraceae bacterium]